MTAGRTCLPPTGRGRPAARPDGFYQPDPPGGPVRDDDGTLRAAFTGEDGRTRTYSFARLPLPGMHEDLAAAFAQRTGPAGTRRTLASANFTWFKLGGMLRFLAGLPRPPQHLAALRRSDLERLRRHRMLTGQPLTVSHEMAEVFGLLRDADQQWLRPEVRELIHQRGHHLGEDTGPGLPGYSDREYGQILRAARRRAVQIRDRIRAGERLLRLAETDPGQLHGDDAAMAGWLAGMARTGMVPGRLRGGGWPRGNLPDRAGRVRAAQQLFLTGEDLVPLLVLAVALTGRNPETVKELPAEHRVQAAARELGTTPARLGQALAGTLDTLAASCLDIDHSPFSSGRCTASFLMCLHCPNALVLERHLPMLYVLLDRLQAALGQMTVPDWCRVHGVTWLIITRLILPEFSPAQREAAIGAKPAADQGGLLDLLPGPREPS